MLRGSASLEMDTVPPNGRGTDSMRVESMRQRPVSQMFHAKSLEQFLGGASDDDTIGPVDSVGSGVLRVRSPRDDSGKRRERWSLRPGRSPTRPPAEPRQSPPDGSPGKETGGSRVRGHTVSTSAAGGATPEEGKKRSNTFKLGKMLGDMGKGMSNAMAAIPITPRSGAQRERERLLEQGARQAEQAGMGGNGQHAVVGFSQEDSANWERKKKSATTKGKMNALLHSFGSSGENISRHIRKRSVSGKLDEKAGSTDESDGEHDGQEGKRSGPGSRIGRAKSVSDLQKVSKTSTIKKRNSTFGRSSKDEVVKASALTLEPSADTDEVDALPSVEGGTAYNIFGGTLEEVMAFQKDLVDLDIPIVLVALTSALTKVGTDHEGIFRVPGNKSRIDKLKSRIGEGDYDFDEERLNVHDLASALKEWLQSLKEPVVPASLYNSCIESASKPKECVALVEELPPLNRSVLKYIVGFLQTHVLRPEIQKITRMDIKSIATTFAPCIMRCPDVKNMQVMMANIQQEIKFLVNLLMLMNSAVVNETVLAPAAPQPTES